MYQATLNIQDQIIIDNATQRTFTVIGGKGTGKTTLLKMIMNSTSIEDSPILVFDPLSVVDAKSIKALKIILKTKDIDTKRIQLMMRVVNQTLSKKGRVILSFSNMVQDEEIGIANEVLPKLSLRNGFVFFDEIHEYVPLHSGSLEVERYIRHCRNNNIGIFMTTQRPASVAKNVLALTDYLILFRVTWTHDLKAVKDLLKDILEKEKVNEIMRTLPTLGFMEGYVIDYRSSENDEKH